MGDIVPLKFYKDWFGIKYPIKVDISSKQKQKTELVYP